MYRRRQREGRKAPTVGEGRRPGESQTGQLSRSRAQRAKGRHPMSECCASCDAQEAKARADGRVAPDDVCVTMAELQEVWAMARESGQACNGDTGRVLAARYGDRLYHVTGVGWFIRRLAETVTS